jgi:hypothetical protein
VGSKLHALLKVSIIAGVLFASGSVGYYFLAYLPQRDARLDAEKQRANAELFQEKQRADAAKVLKELQQSENQSAAQSRYKTCVAVAEKNYFATWASNCKSVAERSAANRASCTMSKELCDSVYKPGDPTPNCALPRMLASDIEAALDKARERCLQESKAGL